MDQMAQSFLISVDAANKPNGRVEKMTAHREGILHRAFSIFIFNREGMWLLQKRAVTKYHSAGLWTNSCCGHPLYGEETEKAATARLRYEMGMVCRLQHAFDFTYRAPLDNGMIEHEYDHVFVGSSDQEPGIHPDEVESWKYVTTGELRNEINANSLLFTEWLKIIYERVHDYYQHNYRS